MSEKAPTLGDLLRTDDVARDDPEARRGAKKAVRNFLKAVATANMDALGAAMTGDAIYEMPFDESGSTAPGGYRQFVGKEAVLNFWRKTSGSGLIVAPAEDVELSILADGSRLFIEQRGDMTTADGKKYRNRYVFRYDIRDGLVSHVREYINPIISAYAFDRIIAGKFKLEDLPS